MMAPLGLDEAEALFGRVLDGMMSDEAITALLVTLAERGETPEEVAGAALAMRARMVPIVAPEGAIDVCGTGGDGSHSLNVSTAVSIVVAACGVPMAKHGNRAASSRAGAADTLEALGVTLRIGPEAAERSLAEIGIAFLFAPNHHPALARIGPIRRAIGRRTIFNLLGPLANPARVRRQLVGVARQDMIAGYARALSLLGCEAGMVVASFDGLDELSVCADNALTDVGGDARIIPAGAFGLPIYPAGALKGGDAAHNAAALRRLLQGEPGAYRDTVILNAAAALIVAARAHDFADGIEEATEVLDNGLANALLDCWIAFR